MVVCGKNIVELLSIFYHSFSSPGAIYIYTHVLVMNECHFFMLNIYNENEIKKA